MARAKVKSRSGAEGFPSIWTTAAQVQAELARLADPTRVPALRRFFKTGPGEYAEGDRFRGLKVPQVRAVVRQSAGLSLREITLLVESPWHSSPVSVQPDTGVHGAVQQVGRHV